MAKKFVRGITDIKTINNQDFDTNNVNDLLSDGEHNYIHRKKGTTEEYHNLTDNIKTVVSDDTVLLEVTNDNETTNSATLHPKHDSQKEQSLESERDTITIEHGENGTEESTTVDVNPEKVLEHDNLLTDYGISKTTSGNTTQLGIEYTRVDDNYDLNNLINGNVRSSNFINAPYTNTGYFVTSWGGASAGTVIQTAIKLLGGGTDSSRTYRRYKINNVWTQWRELVVDKDELNSLLAQKQNKIISNTSVADVGAGLRQLYALKQTYTSENGLLKTHVKSISQNTSVSTAEEEFNFIVKINKATSSASFTLNDHDKTKFTNIMSAYGQDNSVRISGCTFTLSDSSLTVSTPNNVDNNYVITFSDII